MLQIPCYQVWRLVRMTVQQLHLALPRVAPEKFLEHAVAVCAEDHRVFLLILEDWASSVVPLAAVLPEPAHNLHVIVSISASFVRSLWMSPGKPCDSCV